MVTAAPAVEGFGVEAIDRGRAHNAIGGQQKVAIAGFAPQHGQQIGVVTPVGPVAPTAELTCGLTATGGPQHGMTAGRASA
jgi:hypothetical protein